MSRGLNRSKCQQPLDEDTQVTSGLETSPGQQLWINTQGVLEGRRGAAEDRQLFKPAAKPLQALTRTQSPACVLPNSKLPGIQKLKYTKEIYTSTCQKSHFPSASWLFHAWQKGISSCFYMTASASLPQIPQLTLLQEALKLCMATYLSTHILSPPTEFWATG